jgi:S-adenosylmethionine/arginine decarboxylase-like enzyme
MKYEFRGKSMSTERDLIKEAYSRENAWGISTAIDIHGCNPAKVQDEATIKRFIYELCDFIKMKRYGDCMVVRFGEGVMIGYSAVQLIETSLISAHFVDASSAGYIDIFSCKYYRPEDALTFCKDFFEAKDAKYNYLLRI